MQRLCALACSSEWERHAEVLQAPCLVSDVPRERASPWDKGPEPPAVPPDRIRNDKEARVAATGRPDGVMVEEVKDCVARWPQQEDMKRAGGAQGQKVQALSRSRCGVAGYAWLRLGWMVGREDFGAIYQPGTKEIVGATDAGVHP